jgi:hypothetical protein
VDVASTTRVNAETNNVFSPTKTRKVSPKSSLKANKSNRMFRNPSKDSNDYAGADGQLGPNSANGNLSFGVVGTASQLLIC